MQDRKFADEPSMGSLVLMLFLLIILALLFYKAWNWWQGEQPAPHLRSRQSVAPPATTEATPLGAPLPSATPRAPANASGTLNKCVVNGVTSYTDGNCPNQASRSTVVIDPNTNLAEGLRVSPVDVIRSPSPQVIQPESTTAYANPDSTRKVRCDQYEEEIKRIDERARQPLSGQEQDWLAAKRKKARDEQFRLKC